MNPAQQVRLRLMPKRPSRLSPRSGFLLAFAAALTVGTPAILADDGVSKRGNQVTLNFAGAEIDAVARTMATITGRQVIVDPRVKGTLHLSTERPVPPAVAWNHFLAALRMQGFTVVDSAGLYKVVPETDAKLQAGPVSIGSAPAASGQLVTQIFRLNHETANNLVPILRPLISPNNTININPGNNSLVITDYADNLQRIGRIISALDLSNATDLEILPLKHAIAADLAPIVSRLIESGTAAAPQGQADTSFKTTVLAESRSNALIIRAANPARAALVRSLVEKLDQPAGKDSPATGNIHVVYLKNADAVKLAATLRAAMGADARAGAASATTPAPAGTAGASAAPSTSQSSTGGQIQADAATNALVITAPEPQYRQLRAVIDKLDARRAQVYVESLIAEVNADKAAEFGIQWQGPIGKAGDNVIGVMGTNFGAAGRNIFNLAAQGAAGTVAPATGGNLGLFQRVNGVYVLGFLARFLQENGAGNILSTPNLLTLDNEEAKIVIGQNVPFVTGQYTSNNSNSGSVNPFQTIERKDVGLTLRVKPQISENGTVKLQIFQEVSSVLASSVNSSAGLITNKRSIESNVLVDDGSIVVLGGLLQDEYAGNEDKIPGIGDVPVLGNLFRSETRSRKKTNLMVFLRPVVMRDSASADSLSLDRYDLMRSMQKDSQPPAKALLPITDSPVMPPLRPAAAGTANRP